MDNVVYTTNERELPGVCVWNWDAEKGTLKPIQNVVTIPPETKEFISTSTLHLTPDSKFLLVANRNKEGGSSIVSLSVDAESGKLEIVSRIPCETVPRSFCIDQTGKFVYVAGQLDNKLGVYALDGESGALRKVDQIDVPKRPMWIETR